MVGYKCVKGKSCARACIAKNHKCRANIPPEVAKTLEGVAKRLSKSEASGGFDSKRYQDWEVAAKGYYGIVSYSPDGKRAVKQVIERNDGKGGFGPHEVEIGKRMASLGHSPRIHSHSDKHFEMDRVPGKPLWKDYQRQEGEEPMNARQATRAANALRDLHRMGFYHGDMHNKQFIVDGDNVKMIDFGLSGPASQDPRKVMLDLNKVSGLINWGNPELDGNPYVELVRRYRDIYRDPPSRKKKEIEEHQRETGRRYLEELQNLSE